MDYKVIKDFDFAKKGDVFTENEEGFTLTKESGNTKYTMSFNENYLNQLVKEGYLANDKSNEAKTIENIKSFVETMVKQYDEDYNKVSEAYANQEIPTCVKVEAETVYYNMKKLLNKINSMIDE